MEFLDRFRNVLPVAARMTKAINPQSGEVNVTSEMMAHVDNFAASTTSDRSDSPGAQMTSVQQQPQQPQSQATDASSCDTEQGAIPDPSAFMPTAQMLALPPPLWMLANMPASSGLVFPPPPPPFYMPPVIPPVMPPVIQPVMQPVAQPIVTNAGGPNREDEREEHEQQRADSYTGGINHIFLQLRQLIDTQAQERMNWYAYSDQILRATQLMQHMLDEGSVQQIDEATTIATARAVAATAGTTMTNQDRVLLGEQQRQIDLEFAMLQRLMATSRNTSATPIVQSDAAAAAPAPASDSESEPTTPQPEACNDQDEGPPVMVRVVRTAVDPNASPASPRPPKSTVYEYTLRL
jgi:hypothetical protein